MEIGCKVYFVTTNGNLFEYEVVDPPGQAPQKGCDILIKNMDGHICSGNSISYFESKKEALTKALDQNKKWISVLGIRIKEHIEIRDFIQKQLKKEK